MKIKDLIKTKKTNKINLSKILLLLVLFLISLILIKSNKNFKDNFYKYVFENNITFATINKTYEKYFGKPIPFDNLIKEEMVFNEKLVYSSKESYKDGVSLSVTDDYLVPSQLGGIVVFVGEKEGYGKTVVVQQYNGIDLWYGNMENINVELYDYIEKGSLIGSVNKKLYLVYKKNGKVLDYNEQI